MTSCNSDIKEKNFNNLQQLKQDDSIKLVTIAVKVKSKKGTILNLANQFYDNLELQFFNDSAKEKTIYRTLSITRTKLITQFGIYMPNSNTKLTYQHAFLLNKNYDTIHLTVNDSLDIVFSEKNKKQIQFIDEYTNDLASVKNVKSASEIDIKKEKALQKILKTNFSLNEKKELECYVHQTYLYSLLRFTNSIQPQKALPENQISAIEEFLRQYDSILSPNLQLLEIFRILKNNTEKRSFTTKNTCKKFNYIGELKNIFNSYTAQAFIFYDLKSSTTNHDSCWMEASKKLNATVFYQRNKEKVDSILLKLRTTAFQPTLTNFKLIDMDKNIVDLNKLLLNKGKKVYLIDFWATWCIPCNKENEILKSKFSNISNEIGVIKISLDNDENTELWKKKITKNEIHLKAIGGFENEFCKKLKITEIPRYMLVNNKGELLNVDFYRPSDASFTKYLNASLK
jgi:thiol-disulfide isomerase/thioredoxin